MSLEWIEKQKNLKSQEVPFSWIKTTRPENVPTTPLNFKPSFSEKWKGTPIRQGDGSYKATTGIKDFGDELLTNLPILGPAHRAAKTWGNTMAYNIDAKRLAEAEKKRQDQITEYVETMLKMREEGKDTRKLEKAISQLQGQQINLKEIYNNQLERTNLQVAADFGEMGADALMGGALSSLKILKTGKLVKPKVLSEAMAGLAPKFLKRQLAKEVGLNTLAGYGTDVSMNTQAGKEGLEAFRPGFGAALAPLATLGLGSQQMNKRLTAQSEKRIQEKLSQKFNIPEAGKPPLGYIKQLPEPKNVIELPGEGILKGQQSLRDSFKPETPVKIKSPEIKEAEQFNSRQDYINYKKQNQENFKALVKGKKLQTVPGEKIETPKVKDAEFGKIWDEAHSYPVETPPLKHFNLKLNEDIIRKVKDPEVGRATQMLDGSFKKYDDSHLVSLKSRNLDIESVTPELLEETKNKLIKESQDLIKYLGKENVSIGQFNLGRDSKMSVDLNFNSKDPNVSMKLAKIGRQQSVFNEVKAKANDWDNVFDKTEFDGLNPKDITLDELKSIWNKVDTKVNNIKIKQDISKQTTPKVETSKIKITDDIVNKDIKKIEKDLGDKINDYEPGTFKKWSIDIRNLDIDEVKRVAMGGEKSTPNNIPKTAYHSVMTNIADETKDIALSKQLANSPVTSRSGQEFVGNKLREDGNMVDIIRDIKKKIFKNKGIRPKRLEMEERELVKNLESKIESIQKTKMTRKEVADIINSLIC